MAILLAVPRASEAEFLSAAFEQAGYAARSLVTGQCLLESVLDLKPDILILDTQLALPDAVRYCEGLTFECPDVGVLVIDALGECIRLLRAGIDDVIARPYDMLELVSRAEALLRRVSRSVRNLSAGPITLVERDRAAFLHGQPIDLTCREWLLLRHLVRRAGRTVTRAELLAKVWLRSTNQGSNVVDVHVTHLRQKLASHDVRLLCVRGVGFRLEIEPGDGTHPAD